MICFLCSEELEGEKEDWYCDCGELICDFCMCTCDDDNYPVGEKCDAPTNPHYPEDHPGWDRLGVAEIT